MRASPLRFPASDYLKQRNRMVDLQIVRHGIDDVLVVAAMREVPREIFVDPGQEKFAYVDSQLSIGEGQTISQPFIVARMLEMACLHPDNVVLDVGTGSGYAAAIAGRIVKRVYTVERHRVLAEAAHTRFQHLGYDNIDLRVADGTLGWPEAAPFDAILVAAAAPEVPLALKRQLALGGRLVVPVGSDEDHQALQQVTRIGEVEYETKSLDAVRFVPLLGEQGWQDDKT